MEDGSIDGELDHPLENDLIEDTLSAVPKASKHNMVQEFINNANPNYQIFEKDHDVAMGSNTYNKKHASHVRLNPDAKNFQTSKVNPTPPPERVPEHNTSSEAAI